MKFEELGKQLCTSGWFLGSFCVRSLAALIVLALMMLIAAIWVRPCLAGLGPPLDDAMLFGCSWGSFSIFVVVQLLLGVSSCVCEPDVCLHLCFPGSTFDTMKDLVGLFICSCVCGCLHAHDMRVHVSSGAFEFTYVLVLSSAAAALDNPHALFWDAASALGLRKWPSVSSCCLLRASPLLPRLAALRALLEATAFSLLTRCWRVAVFWNGVSGSLYAVSWNMF